MLAAMIWPNTAGIAKAALDIVMIILYVYVSLSVRSPANNSTISRRIKSAEAFIREQRARGGTPEISMPMSILDSDTISESKRSKHGLLKAEKMRYEMQNRSDESNIGAPVKARHGKRLALLAGR